MEMEIRIVMNGAIGEWENAADVTIEELITFYDAVASGNEYQIEFR